MRFWILIVLFMLISCIRSNAEQLAVFTPSNSSGIEMVPVNLGFPWSDSKWTDSMVNGMPAVSLQNDYWFFCFRVNDDIREKLGSDIYVAVEYLDEELSAACIEYNSLKDDYTRSSWFRTAGSGSVCRSVINIGDAKFRGSQSGGADFRLRAYGHLTITKVELYDKKPVNVLTTDQQYLNHSLKTLKSLPQNKKPKRMRYTLADPYEVTEAQYKNTLTYGHCADDATASVCKSLGATSIESYVTWETVESRGKDQWDWSYWDKQVDVLKKHDMKWAPMLMLGPAYCVPAWFRSTPDHFPYKCLEHDTDSKIESLWNPNLPKWVDRFIGEFAKRYKDSGILDYVLLGISGDYGELIYPAIGGWTEIIPGAYHSHVGFWCGDRYAMASFRHYIANKYKHLNSVNNAWGTHYESLDMVDFPARGEQLAQFRSQVSTAGNPQIRRRWLDFIDWYRASMTDWEDQWLAIVRKHLPDTPLYVCTGGFGQPELGCDFAEQCRIAAKHKAGVRITNEGSGYQWNFIGTRWVASAGKHYNANFGFEPAAVEDDKGVVARIYNATASGADHLHDYTTNIIRYKSKMDVQRKNFKYLFHVDKPVIPVALWYPNVTMTLKGSDIDFGTPASDFRDYTDYDFVDETMLRTDALSHHRILVILLGQVIETADAKRIANWVEKGGRVIVMGIPKFESVEATDGPERLLFGDTPQGRMIGKGSVTRVNGWDDLAAELRKDLRELGFPVYDLRKDGIYGTQIGRDRFLFLNTNTDSQVEIEKDGSNTNHLLTGGTISDIRI